MRVFLLSLVGLVAVSACGGSPTAPSPEPEPVKQTIHEPAPAVQEPPASVPDPAPAPAPTPIPAPPTAKPVIWASTSSAQWLGPAPIPADFRVEWAPETLTFGPLTAAVLLYDAKGSTVGVFAKPNGLSVQVVFDTATGRGSWSLSGMPGQASGILEAR